MAANLVFRVGFRAMEELLIETPKDAVIELLVI